MRKKKNPSVTSTYARPDKHTHDCLHLYASQPPTAISPSSSRGQTIEQLICVLALAKKEKKAAAATAFAYRLMRYTFNFMCQECENSDRCSSPLPSSLTYDSSKLKHDSGNPSWSWLLLLNSWRALTFKKWRQCQKINVPSHRWFKDESRRYSLHLHTSD